MHVVHPSGEAQVESEHSISSVVGDVFNARRSLAFPSGTNMRRISDLALSGSDPEVLLNTIVAPPKPVKQSKGRLLVCDDELISRRILVRLELRGYLMNSLWFLRLLFVVPALHELT